MLAAKETTAVTPATAGASRVIRRISRGLFMVAIMGSSTSPIPSVNTAPSSRLGKPL